MTLAELEKKHILETLERHNHNRTAAARELGICKRTLRSRIAQYRAESKYVPPTVKAECEWCGDDFMKIAGKKHLYCKKACRDEHYERMKRDGER